MKSTIRGMFMLGRGKREGIHEFSNTSDAVLSALAPWIALAVVGNLLPIFMMKFKNIQITYANISLFFVKICCLITTVVIIHCFSALWKKETNWKQTTTALLWCFWVPFLDCMLFLIIAGLFLSGSPNTLMALLGLVIVLYIAYSIWLNWFVVKVGLQITTQKSIMVVLALIVASIIIYSIFVGFNFVYITEMMKELQQKQQAIPIP